MEDIAMHRFDEIAQHGMEFSLAALNSAQNRVLQELDSSSATPLVKALQMVQLQKAVIAVGMFSMFEAMLQDELVCSDGFREAAARLQAKGEIEIKERFGDLQLAVNVLKHGRGRSYEALVKKARALPFRVKLPAETSFSEGDVSEISTLIEVDDAFVRSCAEAIRDVSMAILA